MMQGCQDLTGAHSHRNMFAFCMEQDKRKIKSPLNQLYSTEISNIVVSYLVEYCEFIRDKVF